MSADKRHEASCHDAAERRERESAQLWRMTAAQREAAMWRGELSYRQLQEWTSLAPGEVPLLGGELAWIVMRTPEWAESRVTAGRSR